MQYEAPLSGGKRQGMPARVMPLQCRRACVPGEIFPCLETLSNAWGTLGNARAFACVRFSGSGCGVGFVRRAMGGGWRGEAGRCKGWVAPGEECYRFRTQYMPVGRFKHCSTVSERYTPGQISVGRSAAKSSVVNALAPSNRIFKKADGMKGSPIGLDAIADKAILKERWKHLRRLKRRMAFNDFELAHDPVEYAWFEWDLDSQVDVLSAQIRTGVYRCSPPAIVREAKALGLTRPLAYLSVADQLVYSAMVARAENMMLAHAKPWTRFGRASADEDSDGTTSRDSGWFRSWLKRQSQLWVITEGHPYIVETDIANFFPSVPIQHLLDHMRAVTNLSDEGVRLLEHVLRGTSVTLKYRSSAAIGLPQENHDCSRVLAHSYLLPVDVEFEPEGVKNAYSRWMDDIVVGADSLDSAKLNVRRIQLAMEPLGLFPNTAKTRIMTAAEFLHEYMKEIGRASCRERV